MTMTIRIAGDTDHEALAMLLVEYENELPSPLRHGDVDGGTLAAMTTQPNAALIAHGGAGLGGCIFIKHFGDDEIVVQRLYVRPAARGMGLGRLLVEAAIHYARAGGYARVLLDTHKHALPQAYRLYQTLGFVECEPFMAVSYDDASFMELRITPQ